VNTTLSKNSVMVGGRGRTWLNYLLYTFFAIGAALIIASIYLVFDAPGLFIYDTLWGLLGLVCVIMGIGFLDRIPRGLSVGPDGIEVHYLLTRARVDWGRLRGPIYQRQGFLDFGAASGTHGVWGALTVTTEQARAILSNPSCPHFHLPPDVVDELRRPD
jgi:hypothetical protein